jgi:hypothetical protein
MVTQYHMLRPKEVRFGGGYLQSSGVVP